MPIERMNPSDVYQPLRDVYTQVVQSRGGTQIDVAGTVPLDAARELVGDGDMGAQVGQVLANLRASLAAAGAGPEHVVRINIFTTDIDTYISEATPLVREFFGAGRPASTLVEVTRLADPRFLVEIEATAVTE